MFILCVAVVYTLRRQDLQRCKAWFLTLYLIGFISSGL
jgi:hypothetical protein